VEREDIKLTYREDGGKEWREYDEWERTGTERRRVRQDKNRTWTG
jgi:hypothetical protein